MARDRLTMFHFSGKDMKASIITLIFFCIFFCSGKVTARSTPNIKVNAILKNAAVLTINGNQQMIRKNATSKEGFKLIEIGTDKVTILISGKAVKYKLGATIGASSYSGANKRNIRLSRDNRGMYLSVGAINNFPVNFLVDTGATFVAINSKLAHQLGIDYKLVGTLSLANTASGRVNAWNLKLNKVSIGGIELQYVDATVIEGDFPLTPLLGMSFLSRVTMHNDGLLLTIEEKF